MATPTVVIIPGSFAPSKHYRVFTESLERHGIDSRVIDTPSVGKRGNLRPATMSDDVDEITNVVSKLLDEGKEVVLMTHSYGGIPGTQSLSKLSRKAREAEGKQGGIDKIIYLASVVLQPGVSNLDAFGSALPDFLDLKDDYMTLDPKGHATHTFSDLPFDEAFELAKQMPEHSTPSFREPLTYPGYNDVEVHYIVCEQDQIIPPQFQRGMIEAVKTSSGREVTAHSFDSGHVPTVSQPDNVSKVVKEIIGA
ncbi:hypothetical protein FOCG_16929 [Fusarium oxysporum f. sp. radicis-lycopersici 26381]|nr:hypothetical protein FOWG_13401 [Fusarium oxysporum f. sp. lycopersici MN25]EXL40495.1 hypothetical protein FOCG_16929 [Fusarium oxysporum f. sp. radicis-lycopersici 26381]RKL39618.1 hypothetical protein BFJ70_g5870 [Fusarium oxysporum]